jgi:uncharacterized membrane protein YdjX (TVP38/TMEM64 family)
MKTIRILVILAILTALALFFFFTASSDPQALLINAMEEWDTQHVLLITMIFLMTIISTLVGLPVFYLAVALGFFIPFFPSLVLAWAINLTAILLTFWMVRSLFYEYFKRKYGEKKLIKKTNKRIKKYGLWTVAFSRSIYIIPTNIINFSFPLSKIKGKTYLFGTMIGLLPECFINVATGYMIRHELLLISEPQQNLVKILVVGGFILLLAVLFIILSLRKRRLEKTKIEKIVPLLKEE